MSYTALNSAGVNDHSIDAKNRTILLKTAAKAVAVVKDTNIRAHIFFDEGSQRSLFRV